jgi:glyoxylase-like metal-dependent hydrolase (beta-lactamase superfamily II)
MERVTEGVYVIIHENATEEWPHGNTGVIVGDDAVAVVDATYLPSRARADIALIKSVTDKPVRWLIMSHWHMDHNNGNVAYRDAYPGLTIVSERETRGFIELNNTWYPKMSAAPNSAKRLALQKLEERLRTGSDTAGRALSPEEKSRLAINVRQRRVELDELSTLKLVPPNLAFERELTLYLGRRRIELRDQGRANSPHDVTVYLPDDRVLFTGDIVVQSPLPFFFSSWPVPWIEVLRRLETVPAAAIVPGHGPVMRDFSYTRKVREMLEAATSRTDSLARQGLTLDQIQKTINLDDLRRGYPVWTDSVPESDWRATVEALVERAWRGVRGQG